MTPSDLPEIFVGGRPRPYRRFHVYQHVTSFSHMRSALVGKRTTATSFHRQRFRQHIGVLV